MIRCLEKEKENKRECVCVCVCERERERERGREKRNIHNRVVAMVWREHRQRTGRHDTIIINLKNLSLQFIIQNAERKTSAINK